MSETSSSVSWSASEKEEQSKSAVARFCNAVIYGTLFVLAAALPLFFLPWTIEVAELNKQLLLVVAAAIAGIAWLGKMLAERKLEYRRSVVNVIVSLYVIAYVVSAWMSQSRYMGFVGDFGQEMAGLLSVGSFVILYFVLINNVRSLKTVSRLLTALVAGGFFVAAYALLQGFNKFILPFGFTKVSSFNTVGTSTALGVYLAFLVALCSAMLLAGHGRDREGKIPKLGIAKQAFLGVTGVVSLFIVANLDNWQVTTSLLIASAVIIIFAFIHAKSVKNISSVLLPIAALIVSILLLILPYHSFTSFPSEVMPSMKASADIAQMALHDHPYFGTGPGTFIFDYAKYRAPDVNNSPYWDLRFDRAASSFLTSLATTGLVGTLSWLLISLFLLVSVGRKLLVADEESWHVLIGVFAAWLLIVFSKFVYSSNLTLEFLFWMIMGLLVVAHRKEFFSVKFENSPRAAMGVAFLFILSVVIVISSVFVEVQRYAGEIAYSDAIRADQAGGHIDDVVKLLEKSATLNPQNDVYLRNLSLAYLAKANQMLGQHVPTKNKDEKDADYQARVTAAQQATTQQVATYSVNAVNAAKAATVIDDKNVSDWSVLASVYESLMGVSNGADGWAVSSFQTAITLEPANPQFHTELGKVYLFQWQQVQNDLAAQKDEKIKADDQKKADDLLKNAIDEFGKAADLKSDYAPARYNLALALDQQGKLKDAITKMEDVARLNNSDVGVGLQLSLMYFRDGRKDAAINLLQQVVQISPSFSNAHWYLASMYEDKGDFDNAIIQIQKVLELNPNNDTVKQKLAELNTKKAAAPNALPQPVDQPIANPNEPGVKPPTTPAIPASKPAPAK